jgi:hypothetical protein
MCLCSASVFGFLLHLPLVCSFTHFSSCFWSSFCTLLSTSASIPCLFAAVVCRFLLACCYIRSCQISSYLPSHLPSYLPSYLPLDLSSYASLKSAVNLLYTARVGPLLAATSPLSGPAPATHQSQIFYGRKQSISSIPGWATKHDSPFENPMKRTSTRKRWLENHVLMDDASLDNASLNQLRVRFVI